MTTPPSAPLPLPPPDERRSPERIESRPAGASIALKVSLALLVGLDRRDPGRRPRGVATLPPIAHSDSATYAVRATRPTTCANRTARARVAAALNSGAGLCHDAVGDPLSGGHRQNRLRHMRTWTADGHFWVRVSRSEPERTGGRRCGGTADAARRCHPPRVCPRPAAGRGPDIHLRGWTISVSRWVRFTNDATGHGMAVAAQNRDFF